MLSYERLSNIVRDIKPYGKTKASIDTRDRYPFDWRKHSHKCFFVEKDAQGNDEYHIAYQQNYKRVEITEDEYKTIQASQDSWMANKNSEGVYTKSVRHWTILGIVRNDNTFEFTSDYMGQGDRMYLTSTLGVYRGEIVSSIKHGGTIYREYVGSYREGFKDTMVIPIFKGQRFNIDTNRSVIDYEVQLPYVNKQRNKGIMAKYKDELNFAETMFKTMTNEVFASEMQDVYNEVFPTDTKPSWPNGEAVQTVCEYANENLRDDLYRYMYALMLSSRVLNAWNIGTGNKYYTQYINEPHTYFQATKKKFIKGIKLLNNVLDNKVYKANEMYPSNTWAVKILVNGSEVKAY